MVDYSADALVKQSILFDKSEKITCFVSTVSFLPRNTGCVCDRKRAVGSFRKHAKTDSRETRLENCSLVKGC